MHQRLIKRRNGFPPALRVTAFIEASSCLGSPLLKHVCKADEGLSNSLSQCILQSLRSVCCLHCPALSGRKQRGLSTALDSPGSCLGAKLGPQQCCKGTLQFNPKCHQSLGDVSYLILSKCPEAKRAATFGGNWSSLTVFCYTSNLTLCCAGNECQPLPVPQWLEHPLLSHFPGHLIS